MYTVICPLGNQGWAMRNLPAPIQENETTGMRSSVQVNTAM